MKGKKLLAGVLSAAMVLGTMALPAFADGETNDVANQDELVDLCAAADTENANVTINITSDFELSTGILFAKANTVTINGNGHTITMNNVPDEKRSEYANMYSSSEGERPAGIAFSADHYGIKSGSAINVDNLTIVNKKATTENEASVLYPNGSHTVRAGYYTSLYAENVNFKNVNFEGGVSIAKNSNFEKCNFNDTSERRYLLFVDNEYGNVSDIKMNIKDCYFNGNNSTYGGVKIADDSNKGADLTVTGSTFENIADRPAVKINGKTLVAASNNIFNNCPNGEISNIEQYTAVAKIEDKLYASLADAVAAAQNGDTITILGKVAVNPGDLPAQPNNKKLTFKGDGDDELTFVDSTGYNMYYANGSSLTFDTLTITWKEGDQPYQGIAHTADTVYNNCTINGELCLYASNSETFKNCTFVQPSADAYNVRTWGAKKAAFENCKFRSNGKSLLVYNESCVDRTKPNNTDDDKYKSITEPNKVVVNKCEFYADSAVSGKAAIEVDSWFGPVALEISDSSAVGFDEGSKSGDTLYNIKKVNPRIATADDSTEVIVNNQVVDLEQMKNGASNPSDAKPVIKIALAKNDAASTEDSHVYDIKVVSDSDINKLNSTDLTFSFVTDKANEYAITAAENVVLTNDGNSHRYMFSYKNGTVRETAKEITIGQATVTGYGKYTLKVDDSASTNVVNATTLAASLVDSYVTDGSADGKLDIADSTTDENGQQQEIKIPTRKLSVKIYMNNKVADQLKAYQAMKVDIAGGEYSETIALGSDAVAQAAKVYTVEKDLPINTAYTVTVSGAGYRTARYTVNLTSDKTLNFWNNVADNAIEVELGNDAYKKDVTFLAGDIVKDGAINIYDLSAVVSYFGTINNVDAESEYAKYDLNRDGKIDSKDVAYVLVSWGK